MSQISITSVIRTKLDSGGLVGSTTEKVSSLLTSSKWFKQHYVFLTCYVDIIGVSLGLFVL